MDDYPYEYYNRKRSESKAFFRKCLVFFVATIVIVLLAVLVFCRPQRKTFGVWLYFVAAEVSAGSAETVASEIAEKGGAGTLFAFGETELPLYACYYTKEDAEKITKRLADAGESAIVKEKKGGSLYFAGADEKKAKEEVCALVQTAYESSVVLFEIANGLEDKTLSSRNALYAAEECMDVFLYAAEQVRALTVFEKKALRTYFSFFEEAESFSHSLKTDGITCQGARRMQTELCCFFLSSFEMFGK